MDKILTERMSRRRILQVAGGLLLSSVFDVRSPRTGSAEMTRMRWIEQGLFPEQGVYQSSVFTAGQEFNSVEIGWRATVPPGAGLGFWARTSADGSTWSDWVHLHADPHGHETPSGRVYATPLLTSPSSHVQYSVEIDPAPDGSLPVLSEVEVGCVDTSAPAQFLQLESQMIDGWIISRAGWGANEDLRFNNGTERWPPRYQPVEKVIVHHTVTQNNPPDPAASVRAIYYYHAVTQGWGDIGYNFLVDWQGRVYEGRYGGENVVGAHALQYNRGSMGVALIGDFQTVNAAQPALDSLVQLIKARAANVDPAGAGPFVDRSFLANICGHRDVLSTACPGDRLHARLPDIRGWAKGTGPIYIDGSPGPTRAELVSATFTPNQIHAGSALRVDMVVKNTGPNTIYTQGPPPNFIYREGQNFETTGFHKIEGMYRVGVDFAGNSGLPNPWRWGLPGPLNPGHSTTVTGFLRLDSVRDWSLTASLVNEFVRYEQQGVFPHTVRTLPPPTAPAERSSDPSMVYVSVTRHNVPRIFNDYWEANGGLFRFGYPLTEPIMEVSETDGNTYLTQYFERARFEHHPEYAGTQYEVLLGLLGAERTTHRVNEPPFRRIPAPEPIANVDYFTETGHTLRFGFRRYWRDNGGLPIFGFPISEEFEEKSQTDGETYVVQYFERNRFEWHPELRGTPYEILLGHLAREILIDRGWLEPEW
jgi:hypothetical protein